MRDLPLNGSDRPTLDGRYALDAVVRRDPCSVTWSGRQVSTGAPVLARVVDVGKAATRPDGSDTIPAPDALPGLGATVPAERGNARDRVKARFTRELDIVAGLSHPNIVTLLDRGDDPDHGLWAVFSPVDGLTLDQWIQTVGPMPAERAAVVMLQVIDALGAAHRKGVVHRDISPHSITLSRLKRGDHAVVDDFTVAALTQESRGSEYWTVTTHGLPSVSAYPAPERIRRKAPTPQSDIYSWGMTFIELLTGKPLLEGSAVEQIARHLAPEEHVLPTLPKGLDAIIERAVRKSLEDRWSNAGEVVNALEAWLASRPKAGSGGRRGWLVAAALVLGAGLTAGGFALSSGGSGGAGAKAPPTAPTEEVGPLVGIGDATAAAQSDAGVAADSPPPPGLARRMTPTKPDAAPVTARPSEDKKPGTRSEGNCTFGRSRGRYSHNTRNWTPMKPGIASFTHADRRQAELQILLSPRAYPSSKYVRWVHLRLTDSTGTFAVGTYDGSEGRNARLWLDYQHMYRSRTPKLQAGKDPMVVEITERLTDGLCLKVRVGGALPLEFETLVALRREPYNAQIGYLPLQKAYLERQPLRLQSHYFGGLLCPSEPRVNGHGSEHGDRVVLSAKVDPPHFVLEWTPDPNAKKKPVLKTFRKAYLRFKPSLATMPLISAAHVEHDRHGSFIEQAKATITAVPYEGGLCGVVRLETPQQRNTVEVTFDARNPRMGLQAYRKLRRGQ